MAGRVRQPGWWYPRIFVGGMVLVVVVNLILVYFAVSTWSGLQTENHYQKGLAYNDALAATREQEQRGWTISVSYAPAAGQPGSGAGDGAATGDGGQLAVRFADRSGQPITDLQARAIVVRPVQDGYDADLALRHQGDGVYAAPLTLPLPGQWEAQIFAHRDGEAFQATRRLFVRE